MEVEGRWQKQHRPRDRWPRPSLRRGETGASPCAQEPHQPSPSQTCFPLWEDVCKRRLTGRTCPLWSSRYQRLLMFPGTANRFTTASCVCKHLFLSCPIQWAKLSLFFFLISHENFGGEGDKTQGRSPQSSVWAPQMSECLPAGSTATVPGAKLERGAVHAFTRRDKHLSSRSSRITKQNWGEGIFDVNSEQLGPCIFLRK